jgi:hypothetical protein
VTRIELRERIGERPPRTVAVASLSADGTIEVEGEPTSVDFLASFRVHDARNDTWVSKEEDPALWLELIPEQMRTPLRWAERHD